MSTPLCKAIVSAAECRSRLELVFSALDSDINRVDILPPIGGSDHALLDIWWARDELRATPTPVRRNIWKIPFGVMREAAREFGHNSSP
ncbi:hypothetical protein EG68_11374 [Paragonimus skrjabini miyazakii]|uniref:Uncharacterized protein n=1 Tax=Paragonimus skrjabini miyazakii TaxID=59628 RepID=A0A8S9YLK5_9TREM|nr:hypothetical protein EG68_11374 [Paragonimus skrjabini miyazakii]